MQQESYVAGLRAERAEAAARVRVLERHAKRERKEHEALRDSTARRLAHKLTGRKEKFEAKTSKEEREYVEALEKDMQEKRQLATLETLLVEAQAVVRSVQLFYVPHSQRQLCIPASGSSRQSAAAWFPLVRCHASSALSSMTDPIRTEGAKFISKSALPPCRRGAPVRSARNRAQSRWWS
ncbi:hypothetical protein B0H11DRAFT_299908 [Mycena galericulata]|nr:hypothetical protein B0H11DRAFT_299908 [Mycena galericulata]